MLDHSTLVNTITMPSLTQYKFKVCLFIFMEQNIVSGITTTAKRHQLHTSLAYLFFSFWEGRGKLKSIFLAQNIGKSNKLINK